MRILVKVKTNAKENKVIPPAPKLWNDDKTNEFYKVFVTESPIEGRANDAITILLSKYFSLSRSQIQLKSGSSSKIKSFEIIGK